MGLYSKFVVIDQEIVWFGDVDFLSKSIENAYVLRFENREVAKELLKKWDCENIVWNSIA